MPALTPANDLVRARNVSASEVYALIGKHPYSSPQKIFDRLTAPYNVMQEQNEAMQIGVYMEPYVARYAARRLGIRVRACSRTIEYRGPVNLCATPDYYVLGEDMLMEVKVSGITYGWTADDLHPHYEYQARAQLACTGRSVCIVVALVGSSFYQIPVVRDAAKERIMLDAVDTFWHDHVLPGIRPDAPDTRITKVLVA